MAQKSSLDPAPACFSWLCSINLFWENPSLTLTCLLDSNRCFLGVWVSILEGLKLKPSHCGNQDTWWRGLCSLQMWVRSSYSCTWGPAPNSGACSCLYVAEQARRSPKFTSCFLIVGIWSFSWRPHFPLCSVMRVAISLHSGHWFVQLLSNVLTVKKWPFCFPIWLEYGRI